jgi:copper chaperone
MSAGPTPIRCVRDAMSEPLKFKVEDMTCAHCAAAVSRAIRKASPEAHVTADPVTKLVTVTGGGDYTSVSARVASVGFTPSRT